MVTLYVMYANNMGCQEIFDSETEIFTIASFEEVLVPLASVGETNEIGGPIVSLVKVTELLF